MNATQTICGLYTRVSSRNQADADYSSLETQRERLEAYCKSQDSYTIYRVYEDGGYSADSLDRPALKEMLRDLSEGKLNCVLAYKIDRLTRSVKDFHLPHGPVRPKWRQVCLSYTKPGHAESDGTPVAQCTS